MIVLISQLLEIISLSSLSIWREKASESARLQKSNAWGSENENASIFFAHLIFGNIKTRSTWQDWGNKVNRLTDTSDLTVIRFNQVIKAWTNMSVCLHGTPFHIQPHLHLTIIFLLSQVRPCNTARRNTRVLSTLLFMKPWLLIFYRIKALGMSTACMFVCFWW